MGGLQGHHVVGPQDQDVLQALECSLEVANQESIKGKAVEARLVVAQIAPGDVSISRLSDAQAAAENGKYALAMAAYV